MLVGVIGGFRDKIYLYLVEKPQDFSIFVTGLIDFQKKSSKPGQNLSLYSKHKSAIFTNADPD
jgi:hypothetical protein